MNFRKYNTSLLFLLLGISSAISSTEQSEDDSNYHPSECAQHEYWNKLTPSFRQFCESTGWTEDLWEEGWDWDDLTPERQQYWTSKQLDQDNWEKKYRHWEQFPAERQQYYISQGITKDIWDATYLSQDAWERTWSYWDALTPERQAHFKSLGIGRDDFERTIDWDDMTKEQQRFHEARGWNKDAWESNDKSKLSMYNEEEMDWDELSEDRREYWISRGWSKDKWHANELEEEENPEKIAAWQKFEPIILKLNVPGLKKYDMEYLSTIESKVGLKDGTTLGDNESFDGPEMSLKDYMADMKRDGTLKYFQLEDLDHYKEEFKSIVGDEIVKNLYEVLSQSELREKGYFREEWDMADPEFDVEMLDWSLFVGSTNTTTAMHYDTDLFNFLWVVEGRKRVVMIPNNEETKGRYTLQSAYSGSGWTGIDILNRDYVLPDDAVVLEIGAGEGVMFPYLCWHAVENLEPTVAYGLRVKED